MFKECVNVLYVRVCKRNTFDLYAFRWAFYVFNFCDNKVLSKNLFRLQVRYTSADNFIHTYTVTFINEEIFIMLFDKQEI
jgi:hypothetical protein